MRARGRLALVIAASTLAVPLAVAGAAAPASALTITQPVPGTATLSGVACPTATTCEAVGRVPAPPPPTGSAPPPGFVQGVLVPITSGSPGSVRDLPATAELLGVACPSATTCEAVGAASVPQNNASQVEPPSPPVWVQSTPQGAVTVTNGSPGPVQVALSGYRNIGGLLTGVACPSVTTCEAVIEELVGAGAVTTVIPGSPSFNDTTTLNGPLTQGYGVGCTSTTSCVAVGQFQLGQAAFGLAPGVYGAVEPITSGSPGASLPVPGTTVLNGVACPTATTCEAVGANASGRGVVVPITNGTPGAAQEVGARSMLYGVACASATTCEAVGANASGQGVAVPISNGIPGTAQVVPGTAALNGVACPSATTCEAVGSDSSGQGVVATLDTSTDPGLAVSVPANITTFAQSSLPYAVVDYPLPTATNDGTAISAIACEPPPGSLFSVGLTIVYCWFPDNPSFNIVVSFTVFVNN